MLFDAGIAPSDVLVTRDPYGTLYLKVNAPGDLLELDSWFTDENKIEQVVFADGTVWDAAELQSRIATTPATEFLDVLNMSDGNDVVDALGGDDWIWGNGGNDVLAGGGGNDYIEGDAGSNLLLGGAGDDDLETGIVAGRSIDIGGDGNDRVGPSGGYDVLAFNAGDGADYIAVDGGENLTISLGGGISTAGILFNGADQSYFVLGLGGDDSLELDSFSFDSMFWPTVTLQLIGDDIRTYDLNAVVQDFFDAGAPGDWSAEESLQQHLLTVSATDALGGVIAYQYATTGSVNGLSTSQEMTVLSADDFASAPQSITVSNSAPEVAIPVADQTASEASPFSFAVPQNTFSDPDGDALTYTASLAGGDPLPSWLSFDPATQTFSGTPGDADTGTLEVAVMATDPGGLGATASFFLDVANVNEAPVVATPINDQTVTELSALTVDVSAAFSDPDAGDTLTYMATLTNGNLLPAWLTFNPATKTFSGTPSPANLGSFNVRVTATDGGGLSASDVFRVTVGASADQFLTGTDGDDILVTYSGNDTIDGLAGADSMTGGKGNDTYYVDNPGDQVLENVGEGTDLVVSSVSYALPDNVENLSLTGSANINATGNTLRNSLIGNEGKNVLDGGTGSDTMIGGAGNDTYVVERSSDVVIENAGEGTDTVQSSVSYTLSANVEKLMLTGTAGTHGTGNELDNSLFGNSGGNVARRRRRRRQHDRRRRQRHLCRRQHRRRRGRERRRGHRHGAELGQLHPRRQRREPDADRHRRHQRHRQRARQHAHRQQRGNMLTGGDGNDTLDGGAGADTMIGGAGNDTYVVDNAARRRDRERRRRHRHGADRRSAYTLGANVENLTLTGSAAIDGTGNALANVLTGNAAANRAGGAGNDTLDGGAGADTLAGGARQRHLCRRQRRRRGDRERRRGHRHGARPRSATRSAPMSRT